MKLRIRFTKHGAVRYIGHLDMQRFFQRANRRAEIKVVYSEGFSPHQKMSFAMPLSVGYESDAEYFDLEVAEAASSDDIIRRLNEQMTDGIEVTGCVLLPDDSENAMASVRAADYLVRFKEGSRPESDIGSSVNRFNDADSFIVRKENKKANKRKKGRSSGKEGEAPAYKEIDLKQFVHTLNVTDDGEGVFMKVSAGSADNIKPELVISALSGNGGEGMSSQSLFITRKELYTDGMISLLDVGRVF